VEAEGRVATGDSLRLFIPDQPAWAGPVANTIPANPVPAA
jgi:hypothetical protein